MREREKERLREEREKSRFITSGTSIQPAYKIEAVKFLAASLIGSHIGILEPVKITGFPRLLSMNDNALAV